MPGSPRIYEIHLQSAPIESMIFEKPRDFQLQTSAGMMVKGFGETISPMEQHYGA